MYEKLLSPVEILQNKAKTTPDKTGYIFLEQGEHEAEKLTYGDLDRNAKSIATHLLDTHTPGERALLLYPTSADFVSAMYGCLYAGIIPIPTNPPRLNRPALRLGSIAKDSKSTIALTDSNFIADLPQRRKLMPELDEMDWIDHSTISLGEEDWKLDIPKLEDTAFIQYTSGSTSSPRGVLISHKNLAYNSKIIGEVRKIEFDNPSVIVNWAPIYHDMGLIIGLFQGLYDDSLSVLMTPVSFLQRPVRWLKAISKYRGSASGGPNFSYDICTNKIDITECEGLDLSSWKNAWNSAEPVRVETQRRFADKFSPFGFNIDSFTPGYGLAEATLILSTYNGRKEPTRLHVSRAALGEGRIEEIETENNDSQELVSCGPALLGIDIRIVNPENKIECEPNIVGEIWAAGKNISSGYWNRAEETQYTFGAKIANSDLGPFMRTGDLGFFHNGDLYITGRSKDMIIVRGRNYYPQDIELTVEKCHDSLQPGGGTAFGIENEGAEILIVVQEVKREARKSLDAAEVTKAIRFAIARDQGIRAFAVVLIRPYSLPKTSSGKVMRHAAMQQFLNNELKIVGEWQAAKISRE